MYTRSLLKAIHMYILFADLTFILQKKSTVHRLLRFI